MEEDEDLANRYFRASAALERGNLRLAKREFDILVLDAPSFAPAWDGLGRCYDAEGELQRAGECFRKAIRVDRGNWSSRYHWAEALHRSGQLREACRWLREALRVAPQERRLHLRLGQCLFEQGELEEALQLYRRALEQPERDVSDAEVYTALAAVEAERGNLEAAEAACERACLLAPDSPDVHYRWALVSAQAGDLAGAERLARRVKALDRRSLRGDLLLVNLAMDRREWEPAEERLHELERHKDGERLGLALRAELARRKGDLEGARTLALETLRQTAAGSDPAVDHALATLRQLHSPAETLQGFRFVLEMDCGEQAYYRPYVVLAEDEGEALGFVADLQDELDAVPWSVIEAETFDHEGHARPGVYQMSLSRVLFPKDRIFSPREV